MCAAQALCGGPAARRGTSRLSTPDVACPAALASSATWPAVPTTDRRALPYRASRRRTPSGLPLPPTVTPRGPLRWVHPPQENSLQLRREIDIAAAVRTALSKRSEQ